MAHGVGSSEKASETRLRVRAKRLIPDRLEVDAGVEARSAGCRFREEDRDRGIRDGTPISFLGRGLGQLVGLPNPGEARDHPTQGHGQRARERGDASPARRRRRSRDRGEELLERAVLYSHRRVSRICSRWNRTSLKYWVAPLTRASSGTRPMISLSAISTPSLAARERIASKAWTSDVL